MEIREINGRYEIILASASPRRRELLTQIGIAFQVMTGGGEEVITKTKPEQIVMELAAKKAQAVFSQYQTRAEAGGKKPYLIIAADTIVAFDGAILGKPKDADDAVRMLVSLQGKTHQVYTGVALLSPHGQGGFFERTEVTFMPMTRGQIEEYVRTGEPLDKAGAYGIQGPFAAYVSRIEGDYFNVVGLPLARLVEEIGRLG